MIRFRPNVPEDVLTIADWISVDQLHRHIEPGFFTEAAPNVSCYVVEDEGGPVMFIRQEVEGQSIRMHAQFCRGRERLAKVMAEAYPMWAEDLKARGFKQIRFALDSSALIKLMLRFGYRAELVTDL